MDFTYDIKVQVTEISESNCSGNDILYENSGYTHTHTHTHTQAHTHTHTHTKL